MSANSLEPWRKARANLTRAQYQELYPYPFLLSAPDALGQSGLYVAPQQLAFHTQVHGVTPQRASERATERSEELVILPLRKAEKNPFLDHVSVGRAPNCDVVIRAPSVSKLHGHFRELGKDSALYTDAKSANGTRIDGVPVPAGAAVAVKEFSHVTFGRVRFQLLSAASLYDWLED